MIKKLSCLFVFGIVALFSFFALVQQKEPRSDTQIKVRMPDGDEDDDDDIVETEEGLTFLSLKHLNK